MAWFARSLGVAVVGLALVGAARPMPGDPDVSGVDSDGAATSAAGPPTEPMAGPIDEPGEDPTAERQARSATSRTL